MSHARKIEDNRRLKKLYDETKYGHLAGAWYSERKGRLIRYSALPDGKYWKRVSNKAVRHAKLVVSGSRYKRCFDFFTLY